MKALLLATSAIACIALSAPAQAATDPYLDSVLGAVDGANAQAYLWLAKGRYTASEAGTDLVLEVPSDMRSTAKFEVIKRTVRSASWSFPKPVLVTIRRAGYCVRLEVRRFDYENGGVLKADGSDTTMKPLPGPAPQSCNDSEAMLNADDVLSLDLDPANLLRGHILGSMAMMKACANAACTSTTNDAPITRARFFGDGPQGDLSPFAVSFREGATVILPEKGYLKLGPGGKAQFDALDYNVKLGSGVADLGQFVVTAEDGVINSGTTILKLAASTSLKIEDLAVNRDTAGTFTISKGSVTGELGKGSNIVLASQQMRNSNLSLLGAKVSLLGLEYRSVVGKTVMSFLRGSFDAQLQSADLWLTDATNIRLGYTNLNFVLGCADATSPTCKPAEWSGDKIVVKGQISAFATQITGGQFPISNAGSTRIEGGSIEADAMQLDSTQAISPVTGLVKVLQITFAGDDLLLDKATKIRAAKLDLRSDNLTFKPGQALPVGTLRIDGSVSRVEGGALGVVGVTDAKAMLVIERLDNDEPSVTDGELHADMKMHLDGGAYAKGRLDLTTLKYYRGHGSAKLKMAVNDAAYVWTTPAYHKSEGNSAFEADINVRPVDVNLSLRNPFMVGPVDMYADHGQWKIDPSRNLALDIRVGIPAAELVYAPIKDKLIHSTLCAPKVNLDGQASRIEAKVDLFASSQGGKISVHDAAIDQGVLAHADDRGCSEVAALICGVGGSIGGPLGSAVLAYLCRQKVDEAAEELGGKIRDQSIEEVKRFHYDFVY